MKKTTTIFHFRSIPHFSVLAAASLGLSTATHGAVLLAFDIQNPSSVTITATSSPSLINDLSGQGGDGVSLLLFFRGPGFQLTGDEVSGLGLSAAGMSESYSDISNTFALLTGRDINLYSIGSGVQAFSMLSPAFNGSMVLDLGAAAGLLPALGTVGDIVVGDTVSGSGSVIGQWQAVPEPTAASLVAISLLIVASLRNRRH
jgi:hypothetical protein